MKYFILILILLTLKASAFETTNIQLLYSNDFKGDAFIYDTKDGKKTTLTFEHYRTFSYGDFFMFIDVMDSDKFDGKTSDIYSEFAPRFSLSKILNESLSFGILKDVYIATQFNAGDEYEAYLYGIGIDLDVIACNVFSVNIYNKDENIFDSGTYQITSVYETQAFHGIHLEGFLDLTKRDINTHNQLLMNLNSVFNTKEKIFVGTEWIYYKYDYHGNHSKTSVLQAMIKYKF